MLADGLAPNRRLRPALAASASLLALAAACSTLPDSSWPPHADHEFDAAFVVGADGRLAFPVTGDDVVVRRVELSPPPLGEGFSADGARWFLYPPGARVTARGSLRAYARDGGRVPPLSELLSGATLDAGDAHAGDAERQE